MPIFRSLFRLTAVSGAAAGAGWVWYTKDTKFVPFTIQDTGDLSALRKLNPHGNPAVCIDHAVRRVPFSELKTKEPASLATGFCQGIWAGLGYWYQRDYLKKKYFGLEGRDKSLWDAGDLRQSKYELGTQISDHFEVVERTPTKVTVRCGDTPVNAGLRASDGVFSMEVTTDEEAAYFHLKSIFFCSLPGGKDAQPLPFRFQFLHREYAKLWMETSVRKLLQ